MFTGTAIAGSAAFAAVSPAAGQRTGIIEDKTGHHPAGAGGLAGGAGQVLAFFPHVTEFLKFVIALAAAEFIDRHDHGTSILESMTTILS